MSTATKHYSVDEYFVREEQSSCRHEYDDGEIREMPGATNPHYRIVISLIVKLYQALSNNGDYAVYGGDTRVLCPSGLYTYPDAAVVEEPVDLMRYRGVDVVKNPLLIVEVLSPSTEAYDRGKKFDNYKTFPALHTYLLVAQDRPRVERFTRGSKEGWESAIVEGLDAEIILPELDVTLALAEIYEKVGFSEP